MADIISTLLNSLNETLTTAIVILTASMFLYNITRNLRNRVARTSGIVLICITVVSLCDVLISLQPTNRTLDSAARLQWIGIAFIPAATFHLSDALLATTGLQSRGRRRRVTRLLYFISLLFAVAAVFTDILIQPFANNNQLINIKSGFLFTVYVVYFVAAIGVSFFNVQRARQRCLTRDTRRRMGYLQFAMLTPAFGIFPYSVLFGLSETASVGMLILINLANATLILMLLFLSYPLSFFGSRLPDRVVKADLLRFMLRGPATGLLALAVVIFITPATRVIGLPGESFRPFAVVVTILLWQWLTAITLPWLEKRLIYSGEDDDQLAKLQTLSERLLTHADLEQLLDAILASTCDFLQVSSAFVVSLTDSVPELVAAVGPARPDVHWLEEEATPLRLLLGTVEDKAKNPIHKWHSYWITPLYSKRITDSYGASLLIGFFGIQARSPEIDLTEDEYPVFNVQIRRVGETLDDMTLQSEIFASLEGLLPQISITRTRAAEVEYRTGRNGNVPKLEEMPDRDQFVEQVKAALRHYWGGPGLTSSLLLDLNIVKNATREHADNPTRALRAIIQKAIEAQRPEGEQKLLSPEWMVYNILELRFIERHKVRDVANRLALSEPDLYRKQKIAIEAVADALLEMENDAAPLPHDL